MADLDLLKEEVFHDYEAWIRENPEVTLKELRERLEKALQQCNDIAAEGDPCIDTYEDIPEPLASELRLMGQLRRRMHLLLPCGQP